ncbi:MAG: ABC-type dipeptide/oligopeptide/nickel transport system permease component [Paracoccaceae bacterium]|jgi:ABC-type dipeptide/oligopeptide/nickel transport system permease component
MRILFLIFNRLLWFIPTLLGLLVLIFTISHIIPADPVAFFAGENATNEQIAELRAFYGFDKPLYIQLWNYMIAVFQGDLGVSLYTQRPISQDMFARLPATLELTLVSVFVSTIIGVPLGVIAAVKRNSLIDHVLRLITVSGLAIASFWMAILFQLLFSMELAITPLQGRIDGWGPDHITGFFLIDSLIVGDWELFWSAASHLILPVATLAFPAMATIVRFTRSGVLDAINSNYVLYEQAMGFPERIIIWKYVLRNALIGTVTQIGLIFGILIAGTVVVEAIFNWPGLGLYAVNSILNSDYNAIMGFTLTTGAMFIGVNLAVDVIQSLIDPRNQG